MKKSNGKGRAGSELGRPGQEKEPDAEGTTAERGDLNIQNGDE